MNEPIKITDERGYIIDRATREAYDRIITRGEMPAARIRFSPRAVSMLRRTPSKLMKWTWDMGGIFLKKNQLALDLRMASICSRVTPRASLIGLVVWGSQLWRGPMVIPPSTVMWVPVTKRAASLAR